MNQERALQSILLIDDNPDDRLLAMRQLKREFPQIQVEQVGNAEQFAQALQVDRFDLVVTDYELLWTTGLDILHAIKAHDPKRPIIMFTNSGTQEIAVAAMKAGLDDYVVKSPKHFIRLPQVVRIVWQNAQIRNRAAQLELQLESLLDRLHVGVFRATPDRELLEANNGFLELLGLETLEAAQTFFRQQPELNVKRGTPGQQWEYEAQLHYPHGKKVWVRVSETLIDINGRTLIDGLLNDITEAKQAEADIQKLNQTLERRVQERTSQLEAANKELETFAYSISHDLRAPIRQIGSFTTLLKQHLESAIGDETVLHYVQVMEQLTAQAGKMIDDLLEFSRTGRTELQYVTVDMNSLVNQIKQQMELENPQRIITWQIATLPDVKGDRNLLRQVWQNLIENAVKYSSRRDRSEIGIGAQDGEQEIIFFVRDNGVGFNMRYINRLFGVFQRLHSDQEFSGIGIGLANVQRIIHRHGGRVWAEGTIDVGANFYFSVPK
ncbi:hybrid sensor histidine kinase/response regulator [Nostoc sp. T09]|uniref:sensor histidine kinase n=1 Tax=Nostoc sp. T09 TaxID=1932621 RepID=UPI000A39F1EB|nr:hybrid sensor histidine kinase/response regulator [Nostoc sp. T09]OUL19227.1 hybrid sensor histidine kinase/response regulator [Nostoc sp. T09]